MAVFVLLIFSNGFWSCNTAGHRGSSEGINESKRRGVFIRQYKVQSADHTVSNIINNKIDEAFLEYSWFVKPAESIIDTTCINIVLKTTGANVDFLTKQYQIKFDSAGHFTQTSKGTLRFFSSNEIKGKGTISRRDSLKSKLCKGDVVLGDIIFVKTD